MHAAFARWPAAANGDRQRSTGDADLLEQDKALVVPELRTQSPALNHAPVGFFRWSLLRHLPARPLSCARVRRFNEPDRVQNASGCRSRHKPLRRAPGPGRSTRPPRYWIGKTRREPPPTLSHGPTRGESRHAGNRQVWAPEDPAASKCHSSTGSPGWGWTMRIRG